MRLFLLLLLLPSLLFAQQLPPVPQAPSVAAKAFILTDFATQYVMTSTNPHERIEPASLTKLMTAYLAFDAIKQKKLSLTQVVPVSKRAWRAPGSRMFIQPDKPVTVDELLRGMIVQSGNDACIALAEAIAGSEDAFAELMNREAQRLGMKNSHFTNSSGLPDPQHYTTAYDLTLLASAVIRDFPEFYPLYSIKEYRYNNITQANRNRLLWTDPFVDGVKTGHTEAAGYCLITSAKRNDRRLVSVVLGAGSEAVRATESQKLLNYGFQFFDTVRLYEKNQPVATMPVWKGAEEKIEAGFTQDLLLTLPKGHAEHLQAALESSEPLLAPIAAGQQLGTVNVTLAGKPVGAYPVYALKDVPVANFFKRTWDSLQLYFK
ncbi:MAG: D-alanyl-D-alanine carboxypeptidase [Burkholderiales bacterium]|nr:D-alanyl-D-alanine carboxypeptidase [Burkholderiales bacterium]